MMRRDVIPRVRTPLRQRARDALDHRPQRYAASRVPLGIEKNLRVPDILGSRPFQIGDREIMEIPGLAQHRHAAVVKIEKSLQVREVVGRP